MNEQEKKIADELLLRVDNRLHPDCAKPFSGEPIEHYLSFLKCVQLRQEIERGPQESSLVEAEMAARDYIREAASQEYWSEVVLPAGIKFMFGEPPECSVLVDHNDARFARECLLVSAPTMKALVPFQQARSFADKWSIEKRKDYTVSSLLGGSVK